MSKVFSVDAFVTQIPQLREILAQSITGSTTRSIHGAGPRGSQNLMLAAKARSLLKGRTAPIMDDLLAVAISVLRHRIIVNHRVIGDGVDTTQIVDSLRKSTPVPASLRS